MTKSPAVLLAGTVAILAATSPSSYAAPTTGALSSSSSATPQDFPLARRSKATLHGDELANWANAHRSHLRNKYASKLKTSSSKSASSPSSSQSQSSSAASKRDTADGATLVNYQHDSTFYSSVAIGTPAQNVNLVLDTGSADIWLGPSKFAASSSSTFENTTTPFHISYGSGDVTGTLATDTFTLAGHTVAKQTFAVAESATQGLLDNTVGGIMGLGFEGLSTSKATPFWQGVNVDPSEFAFYLASVENRDSLPGSGDEAYGGVFTLGGTNSSLYQGDINWSTVIDESYWLITLGGITVGGSSIDLNGMNKVAVDTGTTLIGTPDNVAEAIYAQIPDSQPIGSMSGYYQFPCSTDTNATMHFGNQQYTITPDDFIAQAIDSEAQNCMGAFFSIGSDAQDDLQYILGDAFLKQVYSVFSATDDTAKVGFANLATGLSSSTSSSSAGQVQAASSSSNIHRPAVAATVVMASVAALLGFFA